MGRGKWTYHRTYNSCCCVPTCSILMLTMPIWPIIGGFSMIKENVFSKKVDATVETVTNDILTNNIDK